MEVNTSRSYPARLMISRARALEYSADGVVITDPYQDDNPIIDANPAFLEMTGYSQDEIIGRNCRFLQGRDKDQPEIARLRQAIKARESVRVTLRNYRKDGTLFHNELSLSPVFDEDGELVHFVGVQHDITERVEAEAKLRQANDRLRLLATAVENQKAELDGLRRRMERHNG